MGRAALGDLDRCVDGRGAVGSHDDQVERQRHHLWHLLGERRDSQQQVLELLAGWLVEPAGEVRIGDEPGGVEIGDGEHLDLARRVEDTGDAT